MDPDLDPLTVLCLNILDRYRSLESPQDMSDEIQVLRKIIGLFVETQAKPARHSRGWGE